MKTENLNELKNEHERLQQKIKSLAEEKGLIQNGVLPITDGIYSTEEYLASNPKVMWILKEPWEEGEKEGNWDLLACMNKDNAAYKNRTWQVMAYTMCGIREDKEYDKLPSTKDAMKYLESIAYININKMPANKKSNATDVRKAYSIWKELLFEQISTYAPDVIIFGGTFRFFAPNLRRYVFVEDAVDNDECYGILYRDEEKGTFLIDTKHPSYVPGKANRINSMIDLVKICIEKMSAQ